MGVDDEGEKGVEASNVAGLVEFQFSAVNMQQTVTIVGTVHVHAITSKITRILKVGKRTGDWSVLLKARANNACPTGPTSGEGSLLKC